MTQMNYDAYEDMRKRLTAAFADMRKNHKLLARQNFSCCGGCAGYEIAHFAEEKYNAKTRKQFAGAVYYHRQTAEARDDGYDFYLYFGGIDSDKYGVISTASDKEVGNTICQVLKEHGIETFWEGSENTAIRLLVCTHEEPAEGRRPCECRTFRAEKIAA